MIWHGPDLARGTAPCGPHTFAFEAPRRAPRANTDPEGTSCDAEFWWGSNFGAGLDLMAPGVHISTTDLVGANGYTGGDYNSEFNGTSSACPNTAGVVALLLAANPNLTGAQARNILEQTCDKVGGYSYQVNVSGQPNGTWTNQAGYGRINADRAVLMALGQSRNITGADFICSSGSTYLLNGIPCSSTVTWSISTSSGGNPTLSNITGPSTSIIIPSNFPQSASILLTATISGITNPITKTIFYGQPGFGASYFNGISNNPIQWYDPNNPVTSLNNVCSEYGPYYIDASPYGTNSTTWSIPSGFPYNGSLSWSQTSPNRVSFYFTGGVAYLKGTVVNNCSSYSQIFAFKSTNCLPIGTDPCAKSLKEYHLFTISPNPASNQIKIGIVSKPAPPPPCLKGIPQNKTGVGYTFSVVNIYNKLGILQRSVKTNDASSIIIPTFSLIAGIYNVEIISGTYIEKKQIIIQK